MSYQCPICPGPTKIEEDTASGNVICRGCGTILEEDIITAEVGFSELGNGATVVQGSHLDSNRTHIGSSRGPGGIRVWATESREQTLHKAEQRMRALANGMGLHISHAETGMRYFKIALSKKFNQGRRSQYVVASCLYLVCRLQKTSHMLIDFSDKLKINVFTLGQTYLKLRRALGVENLPIIEPEIYIRRFAMELDFGPQTEKVAKDASRLVQRMDRDWMSSGRRPAGLCGAALFIASRMNNFDRRVKEIVYYVKVSDATVKKRIKEFSSLPSARLTVDGFRDIWLQSAADPPGFVRPQVAAIEDGAGEEDEEGEPLESSQAGIVEKAELDDSLAQAQADADAEVQSEVFQNLLEDRELEAEINRHLHHEKFQEIQMQLDEEERRREEGEKIMKEEDDDNLSDLDDDDEVSGAIISEDSEHFILRAQLWIEANKDYLREQREKRMREEEDERNGVKKNQPKRRRRKSRKNELDENESVPATPAESAKQMAKTRAFSKKIDYSAMDKLFADD